MSRSSTRRRKRAFALACALWWASAPCVAFATTTFFLQDDASTISGYKQMHTGTPTGSTTASITNTLTGDNAVGPFTNTESITETAGGTRLQWITDPLAAIVLASDVQVTLKSAEESAGAANATLQCIVFRWSYATQDIADLTQCVMLPQTSDCANTTRAGELSATTPSDFAAAEDPFFLTPTLVNGDRLVLRCYVDDGNGVTMAAGGRTVTFQYNQTAGGTSASRLILTDNATAAAATPTPTSTAPTPTLTGGATATATPTPTPTPTLQPNQTTTVQE